MSGYCLIAPGHPVHDYYHANEYGFPQRDERELFERLVLEINQAGLSWETILKKREGFRAAYDGFEVFGGRPFQANFPAGHRRTDQVSAGLNSVGQNDMVRTTELFDAGYPDCARAGAAYLRTHTNQEIGDIDHFRFTGSVLEHCFAIGKGGCHHQVFRTGNRDDIEHDVGPDQAIGFGQDETVFDDNIGTHCLESLAD